MIPDAPALDPQNAFEKPEFVMSAVNSCDEWSGGVIAPLWLKQLDGRQRPPSR
jgi:hypothetical protein